MTERKSAIEQFSEMVKKTELADRITYVSLLLTKLYDVFLSPDEETRMENIRLLYMAIPDAIKDEEFNKEIKEHDEAAEATQELIYENHNPTDEEEASIEVSWPEYWSDVLRSIINLFFRLGLLLTPKQKEEF